MKQKDGMVTSEMENGYIVIPTEGENVNRVLSLNDSGGFVWTLLEKDCSFEEIAVQLSNEYDISYEQAAKDLTEFLEKIRPYVKSNN